MVSDYRECISRACAMAAFAVVAAAAVPGWAQTYPSRPVELVVGYPQSGAGDIIARLIADRLGNVLGQPFHVENRPGSSGAIAAQTVAHAAPDGHTLLAGQTPEVAIIPTLVKDPGYDPRKDLQPIALAAVTPLALVVQNTAPFSTVSEMLKASRSSKRGQSFASAGPGTPSDLAGEMLRLRSQTRLTHVPLEGAGPALEALTDGRVDFCFSPLPVAMPYVTSGKLKMLALSSAKRSLAMPNVPTVMEETSAKGFDVTNWVGIFAPRGTSKPIVTRLNRAINQTLAEPDIRERLVNDGADITPMSADQFAGFVESEIGKYERLLVEEFCSRFWYGGCVSFPPF
jgi:tripartite-type tricarboxylate transporter receptor subunit TctC